MKKKYYISSLTRKGKNHSSNQDRYLIMLNDKVLAFNDSDFEKEIVLDDKDNLLVAVCDGISQSKDSDVLAEKTLHILKEYVNEIYNYDEDRVNHVIAKINQEIVHTFNGKVDGGTTLSALVINNDHYISFNVGDSPIYSIDSDRMFKLSVDDTVANIKYTKRQSIQCNDYRTLWHYIGYTGFDEIGHITTRKNSSNESFLISSDGLFANKSIESRIMDLINGSCMEYTNRIYQTCYDISDDITYIVVKRLNTNPKKKIRLTLLKK